MPSPANLRMRWANIPGVSYAEQRTQSKAKEKPAKPRAKRPKPTTPYLHPRFIEAPHLYTKRGTRRKLHYTLPPSELDWCTAKQAMEILGCSRSSVDYIARKHNIRRHEHYFARPAGNGLTRLYYFNLDDVRIAKLHREAEKIKRRNAKRRKNHA